MGYNLQGHRNQDKFIFDTFLDIYRKNDNEVARKDNCCKGC